MKCDSCKYAEWNRTSNGRLHQNKMGKCTLKKTLKIPASAEYYVKQRCKTGTLDFVVDGGFIERGHVFEQCAYYTPEGNS
jgi:Holliday junction resolvase-like predicted endonuclease